MKLGIPLRALSIAVLVAIALTAPRPAAAGSGFVLAVSWQPAFCETRPDKPECVAQTDERFDASHFTLHGLWPQPYGNIYCGTDAKLRALDEVGAWEQLPAPDLAPSTRAAVDRTMPGSASFLDRHEWVKHGSCHGASAEAYFQDSLRLLAELNESPVRALFADGIGRVLSAGAIRDSFDEAFGRGAGRRVEIVCRRVGIRRLIVEMKIAIGGPILPERDLGALLMQAPEGPVGCTSGIVDRVGTGLSQR